MAKAKYNTAEHKAARQAIDQAQAAGQWLTCHEVVCKFPTRDIAPWQKAEPAHMPDGIHYRGPAHAHCNRSEGAARGNRMRGRRKSPMRRLTL